MQNKYAHEIMLDVYETDMLRLIASAWMKEPPERYYDLLDVGQTKKKHIDYSVDDIVEMFRGRGKLCD